MPWWVAALGGAVVCAAVGWALVAGIIASAMLPHQQIDTDLTVRLATGLWLLTHGGVFQASGLEITMIPLGFTGIIAVLLYAVGAYAGKQADLAGGQTSTQAVAKVVGVMMATYTVLVVSAALILDVAGPHLRAGFGAVVLTVTMGGLGARRGVWAGNSQPYPSWIRAIPRAVLVGVGLGFLGGLALVISALLTHRDQFVFLTEQLHPGWSGAIGLALIQFFYIPNFALWALTWSLGPGFSVGDESIVSLMGSHVGLLPGFPITSALPVSPGASSLIWLAIPAVAGVGSAVVILAHRPRARADETGLVGGLVGVITGLVLTGLAGLTRGHLGVDRMTDLGPFLPPLLLIAPGVMGLSAMLTGLIVGLLRRPAAKTDHRWWTRWGRQDHVPASPIDQGDLNETVNLQDVHQDTDTVREESGRVRMGWLTPVFQKSKKTSTDSDPHASPPEPPQRIEEITGEQLPLDFHGNQVE
jgi:hypothetical protein